MSRTTQNFPGIGTYCSPFRSCNDGEKLSVRLRVCSVHTRVESNALRVISKHRFLYPSIYHGNGFTPFCTYAMRHPDSILDDSERSFCIENGGNRNKSFFWRFNKHRKEKARMSVTSASRGEDTFINGIEQTLLVNESRDSAEDHLHSSSTTIDHKKTRAKGKQRKQSRSSETKEISSCGINDVSEEVGSDALDSAEITVPTKPRSKGKARKSKKKEKSNKEAIPDLTVSSSNGKDIAESHTHDETNLQGENGIRQLYPPAAKSVMVVESAVKAKVIQSYLGEMFEVIPSYGHVRDLAGRSGSVRPDDDFSMVWEVPSAAWTHLKSIQVALSGTKNLVLASDPDREGEAIAWHIIEMLQQQGALNDDIVVARVVFYEITESSIKSALQAPRSIDVNLVHSYLARRALDYLIGFNISPLLWKKLPGCQSAGRVQSAALSLICDREKEIDDFKPQEYWKVEIEFSKKDRIHPVSTHFHLT